MSLLMMIFSWVQWNLNFLKKIESFKCLGILQWNVFFLKTKETQTEKKLVSLK